MFFQILDGENDFFFKYREIKYTHEESCIVLSNSRVEFYSFLEFTLRRNCGLKVNEMC